MRFTAAICILLMFVGVFTGCTARERAGLPERLTLYLTGERRIITLTREEYLTGCILACTDPSFQPETLKAAAAKRLSAKRADRRCSPTSSSGIPTSAR